MEEYFNLVERGFSKEADRIHELRFVQRFKEEIHRVHGKVVLVGSMGPAFPVARQRLRVGDGDGSRNSPIFREGSYRTPAMVGFRGELIEHLEDWIVDYLVSEAGSGLRRQLALRNAWLHYKFEVELEKM